MKKIWFITGASRGFGRIWAEAALQRGDKVAATARRLKDVVDLKERFGDAVLPMALDVTNSEQVSQVVQQAFKHFGRLDVLVNQCRHEPVRGYRGGERRTDPRFVRRELLRDGSGVASSSASVAETRERTHPWGFERSWDYGATAHRLLLCYEMGGGSSARKPGAGGETLWHQSDAG